MLAYPRYSLGGVNLNLDSYGMNSASSSATSDLPPMFYQQTLYDQARMFEEQHAAAASGAASNNTNHLTLHQQLQQHQQQLQQQQQHHQQLQHHHQHQHQLPGLLKDTKEEDLLLHLEDEDQNLFSHLSSATLGIDTHRTPRPRSASFQNYSGNNALSGIDMFPEADPGNKRARLANGTKLKKAIQPSMNFLGHGSNGVTSSFKPLSHALTSMAGPKQGVDAVAMDQKGKPTSDKKHPGRKRPLTSRFRGVCWYKRTNRWVTQIKVNGHRRHVGYFKDELEAAIAYDKALEELSALAPPPKKEKKDARKMSSGGDADSSRAPGTDNDDALTNAAATANGAAQRPANATE